jgi:hypothetical protein
MFPRGAPGIALLLLRVSVAASILLKAASEPHRELWLLALTVALTAALCVGFLTPVAALLAIPVYLIETARLGVVPGEALTPILQTIALSLLGPGSHSVDAYLYGRRIVVLPKISDQDAD